MQIWSCLITHFINLIKLVSRILGIIIFFSGLSIANVSTGQELLDRKITLNVQDISIEAALKQIEKQIDVKFAYSKSVSTSLETRVSVTVKHQTLYQVLRDLLVPVNLKVKLYNDQLLIYNEKENVTPFKKYEKNGSISGKVVDDTDSAPLPGATVQVKATTTGSATSINGDFLISSVPPGNVTLVVRFIGYAEKELQVEVKPGETTNVNIGLSPNVVIGEEIIITGQALGQTAAINQQISSSTIVNVVSKDRIEELPDQNAAETVGRLPGIAIQRDGGEGQKVVVRGLSPRFNAITINGERIPSTDAADRSVDLSMIAPEQLAGIEVYKALRPDQDGDAIGGSVNFVVKEAPDDWQGTIRTEYGYNGHAKEWGQLRTNFSISNRFFKDKLGAIVTGNFQRANRSSDNLRAGFVRVGNFDTYIRSEVSLRDDDEIRLRYGGSAALDYQFNEFSSILLNTIWGETDRDAINGRRDFDTFNDYQDHEIRISQRRISLLSNGLSGDHKLGNKTWTLTWKASYSLTRQKLPYDARFRFRETSAFENIPEQGLTTDVPATRVPTFAKNNFNSAFLRRVEFRDDLTSEDIYTLSLDLQKDIKIGANISGFIKGGLKGRFFDRVNDAREIRDIGNGAQNGLLDLVTDFPGDYETLADRPTEISMSNFISSNTEREFLEGDFAFTPTLSEQAARDFILFNSADYLFRNDLVDNEDYFAEELITASYLMTELNWGKFMFLGGVRIERTDANYQGFITSQADDEVEDLDPDEVVTVRIDTSSSISYTEILPMLHLRYKLTDWFDIRAAMTKSLARPNFQNLVPWAQINPFESTARLGNPQLQHMVAWNYDLFFSFYNKWGLFTVGLFAKELSNVDVDANFIETDRRDPLFGYDVTQPLNAEGISQVFGVEFDLQTNLRMLPSPLDGIVISANLTLINSETFYPLFLRTGDSGAPFYYPSFVNTERTGSLPGQPRFTSNLSLGYEKGGFSGRISSIVQDDSFDELGNRPEEDSFDGLVIRWDATARQKITEKLQLYANFNNITNEPITAFFGIQDQISAQEFFGFTADIGIRYKF
jgi:TonB-dependent receptor